MRTSSHRRAFLQTAGMCSLGFLQGLPALGAADTKLDPNLVRLGIDTEPLVRLIEETPRQKLLEEIGAKIKKGLSYQELLAALLIAGVRNIQPRPHVGFKFHAVLAIHSAHLASLAASDKECWLPIFWALDLFKSSQATNIKESGWRMKPVDEAHVPAARQAKSLFVEAMTGWDEAKADVAAAAVARHLTPREAFDLYVRFGCRDFRDIGHKAIYVANAFRTLQVIGWHHAEPILRSIAYALLMKDGSTLPNGQAIADRAGIRNRERSGELGAEWRFGEVQSTKTNDLLETLRQANDLEMADRTIAELKGGLSPRSVWDAVFLSGAEMLMRKPGIVSLHSVTSANALRYGYENTSDDETRKLLLLQAVSFMTLFRQQLGDLSAVKNLRIDQTNSQEAPEQCTLDAIFAALPKDKALANRLALGYLKANPNGAHDLAAAGRRLIFLKGTDSHDYKFSSAVLEDYRQIQGPANANYLAASLYWFKGTQDRDSPLVPRIRAALS